TTAPWAANTRVATGLRSNSGPPPATGPDSRIFSTRLLMVLAEIRNRPFAASLEPVRLCPSSRGVSVMRFAGDGKCPPCLKESAFHADMTRVAESRNGCVTENLFATRVRSADEHQRFRTQEHPVVVSRGQSRRRASRRA